MHRALFILEVARNIILHHESKKDLAALAQTCHALSEPALDALWSELTDLTPLLECLPDDPISWSTPARIYTRDYSLRQALTPYDWTIFRKYASRVNVLEVITAQCVERRIKADVFLALSCPPYVGPLFPKLRSLEWLDVRPEGFKFLKLMLGPFITHLFIHHHFSEKHALGLIAVLGTVCPRLKYFRWTSEEYSPQEPSAISESMTLRSELQQLTCTSMDERAIQRLSSLQSLRKVHIIVDTSPLPPLHKPTFPFLEVINITTPSDESLSTIARFIRTFHSCTIAFCVAADVASAGSLLDLVEAASTHCDRTMLERFVANETTQERGGFMLDKTTFEHLFSFRNLTFVSVSTRRNVHLNDAAMLEMANAWPNLYKLAINEISGWGHRSGVTLRGLRSMLQRLPKLTSLRIAIDAETPAGSYTSEDDSHPFSATGELMLDVMDSRIAANVSDVAAFLSDFLPDIHGKHSLYAWEFREYGAPNEGREEEIAIYSERWEKVWEAMYEMKNEGTKPFVNV